MEAEAVSSTVLRTPKKLSYIQVFEADRLRLIQLAPNKRMSYAKVFRAVLDEIYAHHPPIENAVQPQPQPQQPPQEQPIVDKV